jgi:hypothetical protein
MYRQKHLLRRDRLVIGLQADSRVAFLGAKLNLMIDIALDYITGNDSNLISALEDSRQGRQRVIPG